MATPPPTPIYVSRRARNVIALAVGAAVVATSWAAPSALVVLLLGILLAILLSIPVRVSERLAPSLPRGLAALASLALVVLLLAAVLFLVIPSLLGDLDDPVLAAGRVLAGFLLRRLRPGPRSGRRRVGARWSNRTSQAAARQRSKRFGRGP